jgi:hypothetical protein
VVRSNYDFTNQTTEVSPILFKIHGCITKDRGFGDQSGMLLTEKDYDQFETFQETAFRSLALDLVTCDVLVIGQSLRDRHLRDLVKKAARLRQTSGTSGRVLLLAYEHDDDRAQLMEQQGIQTFTGSLETLLHALSNASPSQLVTTTSTPIGGFLTPGLATTCVDVSHARALHSDPVRLFNGAPASYADIADRLTMRRNAQTRFAEAQDGGKGFFLVITGNAGVGKTTLARSLLIERNNADFACWEHLNSFPLDSAAWLRVEANLRASGRQGFLLVDDCTQHMAQLNRLADRLGSLDRPYLRIVVTANVGTWRSRTKSSEFFRRGTVERIGRLTDADIENFVNLVDREPRIGSLIEPSFSVLSRPQRVARLRDRCNAEMYVCLKNIFGKDELDDILLAEFASLPESEQDIYRHVSVLQAMGSKVHRQLIMRLLNVEAGQLEAMLVDLDGIVNEYDIRPAQGLYGWSVRHDVIAEVISTYKFASPEDLKSLLTRVIDGINPSIYLELESARAICTTEWGIERLTNPTDQIELLKQLITVVPGERIPRRRLIKRYLDSRQLGDAAQSITLFRSEIGNDTIIDRYNVLLLLHRSDARSGILNEDRLAILHQAANLAHKNIEATPNDQQNYRVLSDVGVAFARRAGNLDLLTESIEVMRAAESFILDPEFARMRRRYEGSLVSYGRDVPKGSADGRLLEDEILATGDAQLVADEL